MSKIKMNSVKQLCDFLANHRRDEWLTQAEVAGSANIPASYLSLIEAGKTDIRLSTLFRLCRALGLRVEISADKDTPG